LAIPGLPGPNRIDRISCTGSPPDFVHFFRPNPASSKQIVAEITGFCEGYYCPVAPQQAGIPGDFIARGRYLHDRRLLVSQPRLVKPAINNFQIPEKTRLDYLIP